MRGREKEKRKLPGARECVGVSGCPARERPRCVISPFLKCTSLGEAGCPGDCLAFRQDNSIKKKKKMEPGTQMGEDSLLLNPSWRTP